MRLEDAYRLLDIDPRASEEEIRRAYRDLTKVWHPDRFGHDEALRRKAEEKLKRINEAWETIRASRGGGGRGSRSRAEPPRDDATAWRVRWKGRETRVPDLAAIADLITRGSIGADAEIYDPKFGRWVAVTEFPVLAEALARKTTRSSRSWAITCAMLGIVILLRRPTPAGLGIAIILFVLAFVFLRRMNTGRS